jgi:hypothetical protein
MQRRANQGPARLGVNHTEKTKKLIAKKATGFKHSPETLKLMSEQRKGRVPWNKGIKASDESKRKISKALTGRKHSKSAIDNMRKAQQERRAKEKSPTYC